MSERRTADLVLRGGVLWTGEGTRATALAAAGGRILAVGGDADVSNLIGRGTRVVDLDGRTLLPGFVDAHTHFLVGGLRLAAVQLRDAHTRAELVRRIAERARGAERGEWITGGDWDHERWGGELPRSDWIDSVTPTTPVFVTRVDLHMGLANSVALAAAGIAAGTPDPPGGTIVRDPASGAPTGILKDKAIDLLTRVIPAPTAADLDRALGAAERHALSLGVTQVHDMGPIPAGPRWHLATYRRARDGGRLGLRVYAFVAIEGWEEMHDLVSSHGTGDDRLRWGGVKGFVDGSLGSTTAWFWRPYDDAPASCGLTVTDLGRLREWIHRADAAGLHVAVHAIGDRANDWLLDVYGSAAAVNGPRDRRFRIEHAQHLGEGAIRRFGEQRVIASVQPCHLVDDGAWAERRIGADRVRRTYAFRSLADAGAPLALGTDWTVAPLDPLPNIAAAVTRRTRDGRHPDGWVSAQKISLEECLAAYTRGAAYAGYAEAHSGVLRPGAFADLAVISGDLFSVPPEEIETLHVTETFVEGEEVYRRG
jgi:predicted amidohydrolase YtcJ